MKPASDTVQAFEYAHRDLELERRSDKYDNRDVLARSLGGWADARNGGGKPAIGDAEIPANDPSARLADGYAMALEP